jgi:hypothetical protein
MQYAKARGVKLLQAYSGCEYKETGNATLRAGIIKDALTYAPPPWGKHQANTSFDGLFQGATDRGFRGLT